MNRPGATEVALLAAAQAHLTARFERQGAMVRPDGTVASESQAYAMLRAVWSDDRAAFDRTWGWTQTHLLNGKGLLSWLWKDGAVVDAHAAADADTDAALALLMAGRRWNDPALVEAGQRMVRAIWAHEVVTVAGRPTSPPGTGRPRGRWWRSTPATSRPTPTASSRKPTPSTTGIPSSTAATTPSSPRRAPPWGQSARPGSRRTGWGSTAPPASRCPCACRSGDTTRYGFDAARTYWRVALDLRWTGDGRARAYLSQAGFLRDEVERKGEVSAVYARDGTIEERTPSVVGQAGALAALLTLDPPLAHRLYAGRFVGAAVYAPSRPRRRRRTAPAPSGPARTTSTPRTGGGSPPPSTRTPSPTSGCLIPAPRARGDEHEVAGLA